ncbi:uncharacterized protein LOC142981682 isoform X2 [Anticarsia gemmatalis]|uniref:uncharacterized protein LOC142981682 isoform X2 n=1 Tax=Anticarsia gemmatalis TaxID=129554 RepID=UPI003F75D34D
MFILWMVWISQLIEVDYALNLKSQNAMRMSLQHVNDMLAEIDSKIEQERNFLSRFEEGPKSLKTEINIPNPVAQSTIKSNLKNNEPKLSVAELNKQVLAQSNNGIQSIVSRWLSNNNNPKIARQADGPKNDGLVLPPTEEHKVEEIPELPPGWPFDEAGSIAPSLTQTTVASNYSVMKQDMINMMMTEGIGYFSASFRKLLQIFTYSAEVVVDNIAGAFGENMKWMSEAGELEFLGGLLETRIKKIGNLLMYTHGRDIQVYAGMYYNAYVEKNINEDILSSIALYDQLIKPEEGDDMFEAVEAIYWCIEDSDVPRLRVLSRNLSVVVLAPAKRMSGTYEMKTISRRLNHAYEKLNVDFMFDLTGFSPRRYSGPGRRMNKKNKLDKSDYDKLMKHFISKHSSLFKRFAKHYIISKQRKQRRLRYRTHRKPHHYSHSKKHRHNSLKHKRDETIVNETTSHSSSKSKKPVKLRADAQNGHFMKFKQHKIHNLLPDVTAEHDLMISTNMTRRVMGSQNIDVGAHALTRKPAARGLHSNNKLLDQITGQSSYSDEETHLKTMLYDAFFHGNNTLHQSSECNKNNLTFKAIASGSDEEWILKNNIYKVFEQSGI